MVRQALLARFAHPCSPLGGSELGSALESPPVPALVSALDFISEFAPGSARDLPCAPAADSAAAAAIVPSLTRDSNVTGHFES